jgi:L-aminopeptidase/D-esterase-like protein
MKKKSLGTIDPKRTYLAPRSSMNPTPGPLNLITDIGGLVVGHAEAANQLTGVTVLIPERPAITAIDQRGGAPGTRETDVFTAENSIDVCHAVVFSGGSAFGLDSAAGVQRWLFERGSGFAVGKTHIPIVPCAVIFDLFANSTGATQPTVDYRELGRIACEQSSQRFLLGNAGAGCGAIAGELKGGAGSASLFDPQNDYMVGAIAVVNSAGSPIVPGSSTFWAWPFEQQNELGGQLVPKYPDNLEPHFPRNLGPAAHTTLVAVATDAPLTSNQTKRLAIMAQDGLARALRPVHAPQDGDTVFALSTTGTSDATDTVSIEVLARLGALAADCTARAIARGVFEAESTTDTVSYQDKFIGNNN